MKFIAQSIILQAIALLLASYFLSGLTVTPGVQNYLFAGILLTAGEYILKPILKIISLPISIITFGLFSFVVNAAVLYLITQIYPVIQVSSFTTPQIPTKFFVIPSMHLNIFLSYALISATIYFISKFLSWFFDR